MPIVECVPNFSEGRDGSVVEDIANAIASVPRVAVLGRERDADHNRAVITFAGEPESVAEAALLGIAVAVDRIDMRGHSGVHPRIGAADVVPFVPIRDITLEDCAALARRTAAELWRRHSVPVYLYEAAALLPERRRLENIRRGGLEFLRAHTSERPPDVGVPHLHPTAGAVAMGARKLLVAFNLFLNTPNVEPAREIARTIRESSGGFPCIKALGLPIAARGQAQVSVNFTDFEVTGLRQVWDAVNREAARLGVEVVSTELIGFMPQRALAGITAEELRIEGFSAERILENRLRAAGMPPSES